MFRKSVIGLVLFTVLLSACGGAAPTAQREDPTLKIAVLPILDALPMYVAEAQGYFKDAGITVEFLPVASAAERDQVMQSGQVDGMINDLTSTVLYNKDAQKIAVVRFARTASADKPQFSLLVAKDSGITTPVRLTSDLLDYGVQTILFARARRTVEIMLRNLRYHSAGHAEDVAAYRSGYLPSERREIERKLRQGMTASISVVTSQRAEAPEATRRRASTCASRANTRSLGARAPRSRALSAASTPSCRCSTRYGPI